jgi:hypothetical protein
MRASGMRTALITASVVSLVTGGCVASATTGSTRAPIATSAPAGATSPGSTGYSARGNLEAVAATSATNVWAIGYFGNGIPALIVHWDGRRWGSVPVRIPTRTSLNAVAASSSGNAWILAEAYHGNDSTWEEPLILHWDGHAWRQVPFSAPSGTFLSSVSVTSPTSAWAVGSYTSADRFSSSARPIALHWNGSAWRRVLLPSLPMPAGGGATLSAVSATSASNAWATGTFLSSEGSPGAGFVLHWNGSSWSQVPSAPASAGNPIAVVATATDYAWLAGTVSGLWNGHDWQTVPIPLVKRLPDGRGGDVHALAVSGHTAWMAGTYCTTGCGESLLPLLLHWTGEAWQLTPPPASTFAINGLAATSATNAWAVGQTASQMIVILHWNGSQWS